MVSSFAIHSCKKDKVSLPVLTTASVTGITRSNAMSGGSVTDTGGAVIFSKGVCWSTSPGPTLSNYKTNEGGGSGQFVSTLSGLATSTKYYVRAYATNNAGTGYGNEVSFTTSLPAVADVTTTGPLSVTLNSAIGGGDILSENGASVTERGICWSTTKNPTTAYNKTIVGGGSGTFSGNLSGLLAETVYHVRAYATNSIGTSYGEDLCFKTYTSTLTDINGNTYYTIAIGSQVWMAENLRVTKYRNGDPIPDIGVNVAWDTVITPASCIISGVSNYSNIYGRLYNWFAVSDSRNICPAGWHVSTDAEWTQLTDYLGGENVAGGKLKESGKVYWNNSDSLATNESGFTGRPGAMRTLYGGIEVMPGDNGAWWTATQYDSDNAWNRWLSEYDATVSRTNNTKKAGFSVRCVKD